MWKADYLSTRMHERCKIPINGERRLGGGNLEISNDGSNWFRSRRSFRPDRQRRAPASKRMIVQTSKPSTGQSAVFASGRQFAEESSYDFSEPCVVPCIAFPDD
jgi:hypothetical protein